MARPLRIQYERAFYHITGRGNEKEALSLLNPENLHKKDTSSRRSLKTPLFMEEIADIISRSLNVPREHIID